MAVTRLKRRILHNKVKAKTRLQQIKRLSFVPQIKQVDVEAIKATFISGD